MEAIQSSWDNEGMIMQEDGGVEDILEHFTLQPCDFELAKILHHLLN